MLLFACLMMLPNWRLLGEHRRLAALAWLVVAMMVGCGTVVALAFWGGVSKSFPQARLWFRRLPKGEQTRSLPSRPAGSLAALLKFLGRMLAISMVLNVFCVLQILGARLGTTYRYLADCSIR